MSFPAEARKQEYYLLDGAAGTAPQPNPARAPEARLTVKSQAQVSVLTIKWMRPPSVASLSDRAAAFESL
jgi:hypothetical protein